MDGTGSPDGLAPSDVAPPAIDRELGRRDIAAFVGGAEERGLRLLRRRPGPAERRALACHRLELPVCLRGHVRVREEIRRHDSGAEGVDAKTLGAELGRHRAREGTARRLARGIERAARRALHLEIELPVVERLLDLGDRRDHTVARVHHEDIDPAERLLGTLGEVGEVLAAWPPMEPDASCVGRRLDPCRPVHKKTDEALQGIQFRMVQEKRGRPLGFDRDAALERAVEVF